MAKRKKKNPAAVALGLRGARARQRSLTKEQRSEQARRAVEARWRKAKPNAYPQPCRWYGLFAAGDDINHPEVLLWAKDKAELRARSRTEDRPTWIVDVDYDPTKFTIVREFRPDTASQVKALQTLLSDSEGGQP